MLLPIKGNNNEPYRKSHLICRVYLVKQFVDLQLEKVACLLRKFFEKRECGKVLKCAIIIISLVRGTHNDDK